MTDRKDFDSWWARNHPFDWYARELGQPMPTELRIHIWALCDAAWRHREPARRLSETQGAKP